MAAGEEEPAIQEQVEYEAASYTRFKESQANRKAKLQTVIEDELAAPGQIDAMMMTPSPGGASSSTGIVPVRVQELEERTSSNLRGSRHRRTDSVDSTTSTVATVSDAKQQYSDDVNTLVQVATQLKIILNQRAGVGDVALAGEITTLVLQITTLRANGRYKKQGIGRSLYINAKKRLLDIVEEQTPPPPPL